MDDIHLDEMSVLIFDPRLSLEEHIIHLQFAIASAGLRCVEKEQTNGPSGQRLQLVRQTDGPTRRRLQHIRQEDGSVGFRVQQL